MDKKILIFFLVILLSYNVMALGITPGRSTFEYQSGEEKKVDFTIVNTEKKEMNLVVLIEGEFNESIGLSENSLKMVVDYWQAGVGLLDLRK